ncbi:hypothetical protein BIW11_04529 [Tropilaelaps mercedesae]|uniref:Cation/H+ exchanger transmembrane domain-containing protein n=1 Tax=Tropilaelaps mercedesae TaxID=418985 RepID=A0A1V9X4R4_9ACAR|nr:hypothetical protein BIW11_04529 [Tropilaelaps mercedesae]
MPMPKVEATRPAIAEATRWWPPTKTMMVNYVKFLASLWLCIALFYLALWGVLRDKLYPYGSAYQLTALTVTLTVGHFVGEVVTVAKVPNIVGMTISGLVMRNLPGNWAIAASIDADVISLLKNIALAIIMLKAGMGLDLAVLCRLKSVCVRLAVLPGLIEAFSTSLIAYLLMGLPWLWGLMAGFMLKAVSPAVVVPSCVDLQRRHRGSRKGIPTLIVASASFDDVIAIAAFGVICTIVFPTGGDSLVWTICRGPLAVLAGLTYGILVGLICWLLQNEPGSNVFRGFLLVLSSLAVTYASEAVGFDSAGAVGCIAVGTTAVVYWRENKAKFGSLENAIACFWKFLENVLFVMIGASVDLSQIDYSTFFYAFFTLLITHVIRVVSTFFAVLGAGFSVKERMFIAIAWLPKATVQAALGSIALDIARSRQNNTEEHRFVLTLAVLSILLTAPLGAGATRVLADRLLDDDSTETNTRNGDRKDSPGSIPVSSS